jgi:hypothetical protein
MDFCPAPAGIKQHAKVAGNGRLAGERYSSPFSRRQSGNVNDLGSGSRRLNVVQVGVQRSGWAQEPDRS